MYKIKLKKLIIFHYLKKKMKEREFRSANSKGAPSVTVTSPIYDDKKRRASP